MAIYSYDLQGKKDSFADWISNISPTDTFIVSYSKKEATPQPKFKWQTDHLDKVVYDIQSAMDILEGADYDPQTEMITTFGTEEKDGNTQMFIKNVAVSDTAIASSAHGRANELKYQLEKGGKELKAIMEVVFSSKQEKRPATSAQSARTDGLFKQIADLNVDNPDLPDPTTYGGAAGDHAVHIEATAAGAIDFEKDFDKVANALYRSGSKACTIVVNPVNAPLIAKLADDASKKIRQLQTFDKRNPKPQYEWAGGYDETYSITDLRGCGWCVCFCRYCPTDLVYFVDPDTISQRVLREPKATKLGKKGNYEVWQLAIEAGLCLSHPYAAGVIELK